MKNSPKLRTALAGSLATGLVVAFAALGGGSTAQSAISAAQYQYGKNKVTICHKGRTISVAQPAVRAHQRHGDQVGTCAAAAAKAKKAKAAAAKARAAAKKAAKQAEQSAQQTPGKAKGKGK